MSDYMYLPTVNGKPAEFNGGQLVYVSQSNPHQKAKLYGTIYQVKKLIDASKEYRYKELGIIEDDDEYGYVKVLIPNFEEPAS